MKIIASFLITCFTLLFIECKSSQFVANPEFNVSNATYHTWIGAQPGVGGTTIKIEVENANEINFGAIYFRGKQTKLERSKKNKSVILIGHFPKKTTTKELILDKNPVKELENDLPKDVSIFPFQLEKNEIVISYSYKEKIKYFKTTITKQKTKHFQ